MDTQGEKLAARIRNEREARGWALDELARRSSVSRAMISKIERCEASPTATILVRLAGAFDLTLAGLIARAAGGGGRLVRLADQPIWRDPGTGYLRRQVFERPDNPLELARIELPAGARVSSGASAYLRTRHLVWVLEGALVIEEGAERHDLAAGDCLSFGLPAQITYANETDATCIYLVVVERPEPGAAG
jgi:transcriptional regulator with XRE-family HTH domain